MPINHILNLTVATGYFLTFPKGPISPPKTDICLTNEISLVQDTALWSHLRLGTGKNPEVLNAAQVLLLHKCGNSDLNNLPQS